MNQPKHTEGAFTLIELAAVVMVIAVLAAILLPSLAGHTSSRRIECLNNQKQVGLGFRIFSADHGDRLPMQAFTNELVATAPVARHAFLYRMMSNELSAPKILVCPSDWRKAAASWSTLTSSNLSYFIGLPASDARPQVWLAGDRNLETNGVAVGPGLLRLTTNMSLGWTAEMHDRCGNVVLGDGSAQQMMNAQFQTGLAAQVAETNDLLVP